MNRKRDGRKFVYFTEDNGESKKEKKELSKKMKYAGNIIASFEIHHNEGKKASKKNLIWNDNLTKTLRSHWKKLEWGGTKAIQVKSAMNIDTKILKQYINKYLDADYPKRKHRYFDRS